jgi:putative hemolysin
VTDFLLKTALVFLTILLSAYASLAETAFMSLSRLQLARLRKAWPGRLAFWEEDPDQTLAAVLLANNLINVGLGVLAVDMAMDAQALWGLPFRWGGWLFPAVMAAGVIVIGEILPKVLARLAPEAWALRLAPSLRIVVRALGPLVQGLSSATGEALARLSRRVAAERAQWSEPVIRTLLAGSPLTPSLRSMLGNLLDFGRRPVSEVMVPREEIAAVDASLPRAEIIARVLASGYSRVPVYRGSLDKVVGILYAKDLLVFWRSQELLVLEDLFRPVQRVPSSMPLGRLLRDFRAGRNHLALAVDGAGRVQGLVTMQDALEAIAGEVAEEPDLKQGLAVRE